MLKKRANCLSLMVIISVIASLQMVGLEFSPLVQEFPDKLNISDVKFAQGLRLVMLRAGHNVLQVWDACTGTFIKESSTELADYKGSGERIISGIGIDAESVVTTSNRFEGTVWDVASGQAKFKLVGHSDLLLGAVFSTKRDKIATSSSDGTVKVWNALDGSFLFEVAERGINVRTPYFASNDKILVTSASNIKGYRIWDASAGTLLHDLEDDHIAFSPDGKIIVKSNNSSQFAFEIVDAQTGALIHSQPLAFTDCEVVSETNKILYYIPSSRLERPALQIIFSEDGSRFVTLSNDTVAKVWDAVSYDLLHKLHNERRNITGAAFSADGNQLITTGFETKVWFLPTTQLTKPHRFHSHLKLQTYSNLVKTAMASGWTKDYFSFKIFLRSFSTPAKQRSDCDFATDVESMIFQTLGDSTQLYLRRLIPNRP